MTDMTPANLVAELTAPNAGRPGANGYPLPALSTWGPGASYAWDEGATRLVGITGQDMVDLINSGVPFMPVVAWDYAGILDNVLWADAITQFATWGLPLNIQCANLEQHGTHQDYPYRDNPAATNPTIQHADGSFGPPYAIDGLAPPEVFQTMVQARLENVANPAMPVLAARYANPPFIVWMDNNEVDHRKANQYRSTNSYRYAQADPTDSFTAQQRRKLFYDSRLLQVQATLAACEAAKPAAWAGVEGRLTKYTSISSRTGHGFWEDYHSYTDEVGKLTAEVDGASGINTSSYEGLQGWANVADSCFATFVSDAWQIERSRRTTQPDGWHSISLWHNWWHEPDQYPGHGQGGNIFPGYATWPAARTTGISLYAYWVARPRVAHWFISEYDAYVDLDKGVEGYGPQLRHLGAALQNIWEDPVLEDYWRHGTLVQGNHPHFYEQAAYNFDQYKHPSELRQHILPCDANPPRSTWQKSTPVPVHALALERAGTTEPNREWLVYAVSPDGDHGTCLVEIPAIGWVPVTATQGGTYTTLLESALPEPEAGYSAPHNFDFILSTAVPVTPTPAPDTARVFYQGLTYIDVDFKTGWKDADGPDWSIDPLPDGFVDNGDGTISGSSNTIQGPIATVTTYLENQVQYTQNVTTSVEAIPPAVGGDGGGMLMNMKLRL